MVEAHARTKLQLPIDNFEAGIVHCETKSATTVWVIGREIADYSTRCVFIKRQVGELNTFRCEIDVLFRLSGSANACSVSCCDRTCG